jgi:hypothetical protein
VGVDASDVDKKAPRVRTVSGRPIQVNVQTWAAETKTFTAESARPEELRLRLFKYPAWRVEVNGKNVPTYTQPNTGELLIPVSAGMNRVQVEFSRTPDRMAGAVCSIAGLVMLLVWKFRFEKESGPTSTSSDVVVK